jgi:hypothetical protein
MLLRDRVVAVGEALGGGGLSLCRTGLHGGIRYSRMANALHSGAPIAIFVLCSLFANS